MDHKQDLTQTDPCMDSLVITYNGLMSPLWSYPATLGLVKPRLSQVAYANLHSYIQVPPSKHQNPPCEYLFRDPARHSTAIDAEVAGSGPAKGAGHGKAAIDDHVQPDRTARD